MGETENLI